MKCDLLRLLVILLPLSALAQAPPRTVFEGKKEVLYLDHWASPKPWISAECTVTASTKRLAEARPTLHIHMPVDHYAGEKKYPIGWPRTGINPQAMWERDWTSFEHFEFMVYTESSRDKLPKTPITLILYCPDRHHSWSRRLGELELDQWVKFSLPISKMKYVESVKTVKFSVSESSYKHGDQLHFYVGGFRFVRSSECELQQMKVKTAAVYQGQPTIDVEIDVLGVAKGISRAVPFTIRQGDTVIRRESLPVRRGRYILPLDVAELKLSPGTYTIVAFDDDAEKTKSDTFRVVDNPWKEE